MNRTNTPPNLWSLCIQHTVYTVNHLSVASLNCRTSFQAKFGQQPDISAILAFRWYEPVIFFAPTSHFPFTVQNCKDFVLGTAEYQGATLTYFNLMPKPLLLPLLLMTGKLFLHTTFKNIYIIIYVFF
jgi:hypothetical protein